MKRDIDTKTYKMRQVEDIMDPFVPKNQIPLNLLHLWQVTTCDFGLKDEYLEVRRVNLFFGLKQ